MNTFEDYLQTIDEPTHRDKLEGIFNWIDKTYPQLEQVIKWNQPMYIYKGTYIIGFSTAKPHIAVSPELGPLNQFRDAIDAAGYSHSKSIFRIKWDQEVDEKLLGDMIDLQLEEKEDYPHFWRK